MKDNEIIKIIKIIKEIAECIEAGHKITHEVQPRSLRWCWLDNNSNQIWYIKLSQFKALNIDIYISNLYLHLFVMNVMLFILYTLQFINKVEKLKAFL